MGAACVRLDSAWARDNPERDAAEVESTVGRFQLKQVYSHLAAHILDRWMEDEPLGQQTVEQAVGRHLPCRDSSLHSAWTAACLQHPAHPSPPHAV